MLRPMEWLTRFFNWLTPAKFLADSATDATGKYLADKYTDQRRKKEAGKERLDAFRKLAVDLRPLFLEMKEDLSKPETRLIREVYLLHEGQESMSSNRHLAYYFERHENLASQFLILESHGYVAEMYDEYQFPKYQLSQDFVDLLRSEKL